MSTATLEIRSGVLVQRAVGGHGRQAGSTARAARPAPRGSAQGMRLTRRGRLVVTLLVLTVLSALLVAGAASVSARTTAAAPPATVEVVVQPGQTLWQLAEEIAPGGDPREVVRAIRELNGLSGSAVLPGQPLTVPTA
jgi:nucleoid-associated protein YgaU